MLKRVISTFTTDKPILFTTNVEEDKEHVSPVRLQLLLARIWSSEGNAIVNEVKEDDRLEDKANGVVILIVIFDALF